jgi:NAD(P)H-dependent FMN reductase
MNNPEIPNKLKLLAIAGSPRRGCNTDRLLNEAISGAAGQGMLVKQVALADLDISPCQHCDACIQLGGRCVIEDDMQQIHQDIREFDRFIIASPVFFMGVTAQAKAMIDRCQALWVLKNVLKLPVCLKPGAVRKGLFFSAGGTRYTNLFQGSVSTVKSWYKTLDIEYSGELLLPGIESCNALTEHPAFLKEAFSLGQQLAN